MMKLTVFGNNASCPEADGACSSFLVEAAGKRILLDMGCASLPQIQRRYDLAELDLIVISHLHFDHCGDLFCAKYQIETRIARGQELDPLALCSPALPEWAAKELLQGEVFRHTTVSDGSQYQLEGVELTFFQVPHLVESYAVRVCAEGKILTYSGDSGPCEILAYAAKGADCFLCEASLVEGQHAESNHHLMAGEAGRVAKDAHVGRLLLTHYHSENAQQVLIQAQRCFPNASLSCIGESYEI